MRTLYRNAVICTPSVPAATAMVVAGGEISWLGAVADAPSVDHVVDLEGGVVTAAFVDAHIHATDTGLALLGLDLSGVTSGEELLDLVARHAAGLPSDAVVLGHGWDESHWPERLPPGAGQLDRAAAGRRVYLARADVHSALASAALIAAVPAVAAASGFDRSGWLRREAHHVVRQAALGSLAPADRRRAQEAALRRAARLGIAAVHECGGPGTSGEDDLAGLLALSRAGFPEVYGYWGELGAAGKARELGAVGAGGDLYADGALGSHTAHLREPYLDGAGRGQGYLTVEQVADHLVGCARHGVQGGFHAIGDAALATVLAGFARASTAVGRQRLRDGRHRIEHAELPDRSMIAAMVEYGVVASVQPGFDRRWGGAGGMYASRLGPGRALTSNPFAAMAGVGVGIAFGSDAPVTPLDPWGAVLAAVRHHNPAYRLSVEAAFAAHTRGGWRAARRDGDGGLLPGAAATFAVWEAPAGVVRGLPRLVADGPDEPDPPVPVCRRTVLRGEMIFDGA